MNRRSPQVSIIIPALNEEHTIATVLRSLARQDRISDCEVIVVDGGSADATTEIADTFHFVDVIRSERGRCLQMNAGAAAAAAPVLWFLHVDSTLPDKRTIDALLEACSDRAVIGGCFRYHLRGTDVYYRLINALVNLRTRVLGRPYGDQGIFVRRDVFRSVGGFQPSPYTCEDLDLVLRLRVEGEFRQLPQRVETSARTWKRYGKVAVTAWHLNQWARYEWARRRTQQPPQPQLQPLENPAPSSAAPPDSTDSVSTPASNQA